MYYDPSHISRSPHTVNNCNQFFPLCRNYIIYQRTFHLAFLTPFGGAQLLELRHHCRSEILTGENCISKGPFVLSLLPESRYICSLLQPNGLLSSQGDFGQCKSCFLYHRSVWDSNRQKSGWQTHNLAKFGQPKCVTWSNLEQENSRYMYCLLCQGTIDKVHYLIQQRNDSR